MSFYVEGGRLKEMNSENCTESGLMVLGRETGFDTVLSAIKDQNDDAKRRVIEALGTLQGPDRNLARFALLAHGIDA